MSPPDLFRRERTARELNQASLSTPDLSSRSGAPGGLVRSASSAAVPSSSAAGLARFDLSSPSTPVLSSRSGTAAVASSSSCAGPDRFASPAVAASSSSSGSLARSASSAAAASSLSGTNPQRSILRSQTLRDPRRVVHFASTENVAETATIDQRLLARANYVSAAQSSSTATPSSSSSASTMFNGRRRRRQPARSSPPRMQSVAEVQAARRSFAVTADELNISRQMQIARGYAPEPETPNITAEQAVANAWAAAMLDDDDEPTAPNNTTSSNGDGGRGGSGALASSSSSAAGVGGGAARGSAPAAARGVGSARGSAPPAARDGGTLVVEARARRATSPPLLGTPPLSTSDQNLAAFVAEAGGIAVEIPLGRNVQAPDPDVAERRARRRARVHAISTPRVQPVIEEADNTTEDANANGTEASGNTDTKGKDKEKEAKGATDNENEADGTNGTANANGINGTGTGTGTSDSSNVGSAAGRPVTPPPASSTPVAGPRQHSGLASPSQGMHTRAPTGGQVVRRVPRWGVHPTPENPLLLKDYGPKPKKTKKGDDGS